MEQINLMNKEFKYVNNMVKGRIVLNSLQEIFL